MTLKYLKEKKLLALPFDKGVGICIMKEQTYKSKMDTIIQLPQFEKYVDKRKDAIHPLLKEENRIQKALKDLCDKEKITKTMYDSLRPTGSQPPRLYGLAKVHKANTPLRPVLAMPGSAYQNVAKQVALWLSQVPECNIQTSTKDIRDTLKDVQLEPDEELVSFDVASLYTNVPVREAIDVCADLLFEKVSIPVDKETFKILAELATCNVVMSTHDGFYRQIDGLAMGSPPAPQLANGWLSTFENKIKSETKLYVRFMDDILCAMKAKKITYKLNLINSLHNNLKFTLERQLNFCIAFLDMLIKNENGILSSTWYTKPSDTGLVMNFHALAPNKYKRSVVSSFVHRICRSCTSDKHVKESLEKARNILISNQYPSSFFEPIIQSTLSKINADASSTPENVSLVNSNVEDPTLIPNYCFHNIDDKDKFLYCLQYRGKVTEHYASDLHKINVPCRVVMTLRKLKTVLPSRKPPVEKMLKSNVVYKIVCPRCEACYVGMTSRQLTRRYTEHIGKRGVTKPHMNNCNVVLGEKDIEILGTHTKSEKHLLTLEALFINEIRPTLNTKDEYKRRTLTLKF